MTLLDVDLEVAKAIADMGLCVVLIGNWQNLVAAHMPADQLNLPPAISRSAARLTNAGILSIARWRVYRAGSDWAKVTKRVPSYHLDEGPCLAQAYVLNIAEYQSAMANHKHSVTTAG